MANAPRIWPVGGYAPGSYWCKCASCDQTFMGDKRAYQCHDCVIKALKFRTDLINMDVLARVEAGYTKALATAESWIHDQLDGTGQVEAALADLDESRAALTDLRAMMEKMK